MADSKKPAEDRVTDYKHVKKQIDKALVHSNALHREIQALADFYKNKQTQR